MEVPVLCMCVGSSISLPFMIKRVRLDGMATMYVIIVSANKSELRRTYWSE
jgi:ABC-type microcin C transport system permease subunit YejB